MPLLSRRKSAEKPVNIELSPRYGRNHPLAGGKEAKMQSKVRAFGLQASRAFPRLSAHQNFPDLHGRRSEAFRTNPNQNRENRAHSASSNRTPTDRKKRLNQAQPMKPRNTRNTRKTIT